MKLSIIIPAYNEEKTIAGVLDKVLGVAIGKLEKEIIVVDDASKDSTAALVRDYCKSHKKIIFVQQPVNGGKGTAVRAGLGRASGDILMVQDADLEYDPAEIPTLLQPILDGRTQVVFGSRFLGKHKARYHIYYAGNILLSGLTSMLYQRRITDMETCYKIFTRKVYERLDLKATRFDIEPELTAKIIRAGFPILEVPITYHSRSFAEGKKITWKDGMKAVWYLVKYRFTD